MAKKSRKPADLNQRTAAIVAEAVGDDDKGDGRGGGKAPAAAEFGRKGGRARAEKLTPEQRSEIARRAAEKRWSQAKRASRVRSDQP